MNRHRLSMPSPWRRTVWEEFYKNDFRPNLGIVHCTSSLVILSAMGLLRKELHRHLGA